MESQATQPDQMISFRGFAARLVMGCVAGSLLAFGWGAGFLGISNETAFAAAAMPCAVWLLCSGLAVVAISAITGGDLNKLPMAALFVSGGRMLLAMGLATVLYFVSPTEPKIFWASFLLAGLISLVAETSWTISTLARLSLSQTPSVHNLSTLPSGQSEARNEDASTASGVR
jgi:hypothetical protein